MKKLFNGLIISLALLALIGCANTIGPDGTMTPGDISNPGGIEIPLEKKENISRIRIERYKASENIDYYINVYDLEADKVVDYFVNPGETYNYSITYYTTNSNPTKTKLSVQAVTGMGELRLSQEPVASYDSTTSKLNFSKKPTLIDFQDRFIRNNQNYYLNYSIVLNSVKDNYWLASSPILDSIDIASLLSSNGQETYFDKELYFSTLYIETGFNDIFYQQAINPNNLDLPKTITVKDTRTELVVTASQEGNIITIPDTILDNVSQYQVKRYDTKGNYNLFFSTTDMTKKELIDYFVDKGTSYQYQLSFSNQFGQILNQTKLSEAVVSEGGVGDLFMKDVKFEYNENTGIMQFSSIPKLKEQLQNIKTENKTPCIRYYFSTLDGQNWIFANYDFTTNSINLPNTISSNNNYDILINNDLYFERVNLDPIIDDVFYTKQIEKKELKENNCTVFDKPIKIPDTREVTKVSKNERGIEISLNELPANCRNIYINRLDVSTNKEETKYIYLRSLNNKTKIIDYFVTPNKEYKYRIKYNSQNKNIQTKYSDSITADTGISQLTFNDIPKVTYDEATTVMTFSPKPDFSKQLDELKAYGLNISDDDFDISLSYSFLNGNNNSISGKLNKNTGTINWSRTLQQNEWNTQFYEQELILNNITISADIDDAEYNTELSREALIENIKDFPTQITIKDLREKTKASQDAKGIKIEIGEIPPETDRIEVYRKDCKTGILNDTYIKIWNKDNSSIIDYFVTPNNEYQYKILFYSSYPTFQLIKETEFNDPIKAENGVGDLIFSNKPSASYDPNSTIMTFNSVPDYSDLISKLNDYQVNNHDFSVELIYTVENEQNNKVYASLNSTNNSNTINWSEALLYNAELYDKNFLLDGATISTNIEGNLYSTRLNDEELSKITTLPHSIKIKNVNEKTKVSLDEKGFKIELLSDIPSNCDRIIIARKNSEDGTVENNYMAIWASRIPSSIIDYFVTPQKGYQYEVRYNNSNGTTIKQTTFSDTLNAANGIGKLIFTNKPIATYNPDTTIMTFNPKPDFTNQINKLIEYKMVQDNFYPEVNICYNGKDCNIWGYLNDDYTINWTKDVARDSYYINHFDEELVLNFGQIEAKLDNGITYTTHIDKDNLSNIVTLPPTIKVKDLREKTKVSLGEQGINIVLSETPASCTRIQIDRKNLQTDEDQSQYIVITNMTKTNVVDYFVTPENQYQYRVTYYADNFKQLKQTIYNEPITAVNGVGNLIFSNNPSASYNPETTIMTFDIMPDFTNQITKLNEYNLISDNFNIEVNLGYLVNDGCIWGKLSNTDKSINWSETLATGGFQENHYNEEIALERLQIYTEIDELNFTIDVEATKLPDSIPKKITVKDLRNQSVL